MLVLDSGGVTRLAQRSRFSASLILALRDRNMWPPLVPSVVLIECLRGHAGRDAHANAFLKTCDVLEGVPERVARRAAQLRAKARRGSAETYDWLALARAMLEGGGYPIVVDEAALVHANRLALEHAGIAADETGTAGLAGLMALEEAMGVRREGPHRGQHERCLALVTGARRA